MFRSRLFWKLNLCLSFLIIAITISAAIVTYYHTKEHLLDETKRALRARAVLAEEIASLTPESGYSDGSLQTRIKTLGDKLDTRFTLVDSAGKVIADSHEEPSAMENHLDRPEILAASSHGESTSVRYSGTLKKKMMYFALATRDKGKGPAFVRSSQSLAFIDERIGEMAMIALYEIFFAMLVALAMSLFIAKYFTMPIESMTAYAKSVSEGNLGGKISESGNDEISKLAHSINVMASTLAGRLETIDREKNKLKTVITSMSEGLVAIDSLERIIHINGSAIKILGLPPGEYEGENVWKVIRIREFGESLSETYRSRSEVNSIAKFHKSVEDKIVEMRLSPIIGRGGDLLGAVAMFRDVTTLARLERVRKDFVANVSHELKTPITAIRGFIETMLDDANMSEADRKRFLEKTRDQSLRLSSLVSDVLSLAKIESETSLLEKRGFDLGLTAKAAVEPFKAIASEKNIEFVSDITAGQHPFSGNEESISSAITNLLDNAIKYTNPGGRVSFKVSNESGLYVIMVSDTGIGIEPSHQNRVFERFYRVDKARSRELGGTGLGLSIVKHTAINHGGSVSLESAPGIGSTFKLSLPIPAA